ncbi:hypothetical protein CAQU_06170 [Corynebacterium aquilae DSM 44791]|uniref:Pyridoxal phosphate homeostasis protein n=1 Tax=Corynebacterium aquilae DSM 44791 TaxID=1431546 RepID=A0A1L7CFS5_9CORY|nr:hypothetical protein CAQU_06170 [Corynebacterium aquilae DSM 44791]
MEQLRTNHQAVLDAIATACKAAGRNADSVRLLPVSKTYPPEVLGRAMQAGMHEFGENRPQEIKEKALSSACAGAQLVHIGQLQTNKAKIVAEYATEFQALDSVKVAGALQRRLESADRVLDVLIQVNTSGEPQKSGIHPAEAAEFVAAMEQFPRLKIRGLMTVAVNGPDPKRVGACFSLLADTRDALAAQFPNLDFSELSMGMSGDFELAIAHGSTCVRIGQAIFGPRG